MGGAVAKISRPLMCGRSYGMARQRRTINTGERANSSCRGRSLLRPLRRRRNSGGVMVARKANQPVHASCFFRNAATTHERDAASCVPYER
jgi:hypothetical protein